ncbi:uncharacterized protein BDW70DRAFT_125702 [Aspergillus foveolatus]|uniref:uncharacterized protein n=1 Tax=Aspergillus foveolatus TaxID=210207 RepID=UPI003CCE309F
MSLYWIWCLDGDSPLFFRRWSTCAVLWTGSPKECLLIAVGRGPCEARGSLVFRHISDTFLSQPTEATPSHVSLRKHEIFTTRMSIKAPDDHSSAIGGAARVRLSGGGNFSVLAGRGLGVSLVLVSTVGGPAKR